MKHRDMIALLALVCTVLCLACHHETRPPSDGNAQVADSEPARMDHGPPNAYGSVKVPGLGTLIRCAVPRPTKEPDRQWCAHDDSECFARDGLCLHTPGVESPTLWIEADMSEKIFALGRSGRALVALLATREGNRIVVVEPRKPPKYFLTTTDASRPPIESQGGKSVQIDADFVRGDRVLLQGMGRVYVANLETENTVELTTPPRPQCHGHYPIYDCRVRWVRAEDQDERTKVEGVAFATVVEGTEEVLIEAGRDY